MLNTLIKYYDEFNIAYCESDYGKMSEYLNSINYYLLFKGFDLEIKEEAFSMALIMYEAALGCGLIDNIEFYDINSKFCLSVLNPFENTTKQKQIWETFVSDVLIKAYVACYESFGEEREKMLKIVKRLNNGTLAYLKEFKENFYDVEISVIKMLKLYNLLSQDKAKGAWFEASDTLKRLLINSIFNQDEVSLITNIVPSSI